MALFGITANPFQKGATPGFSARGFGGNSQMLMMQQMMLMMMQLMMTMMGGMQQGCGCGGFHPGMNPAFGGGAPGMGQGGNGLGNFLGGGQPGGGGFPGGGGIPGGGGFGAQPGGAGGPNTMTPASGTGPLTKLSSNPQERIKQVVEAAKRTYPDQPHMAKLAAAQALLESGLAGSKPSTLASEHNNLFGIKGSGTAGSVNMRTGEHLNGRDVTVNAGFAKNATLEDSFQQHKKLMSNSRYASVRSAGSFEQAAAAVKAAGYATDPGYTSKLLNIYRTHLAQYF